MLKVKNSPFPKKKVIAIDHHYQNIITTAKELEIESRIVIVKMIDFDHLSNGKTISISIVIVVVVRLD